MEWATFINSVSLQEGHLPSHLKETLLRPIPKKPNLATDDLNNYRPIANIPFLG